MKEELSQERREKISIYFSLFCELKKQESEKQAKGQQDKGTSSAIRRTLKGAWTESKSHWADSHDYENTDNSVY